MKVVTTEYLEAADVISMNNAPVNALSHVLRSQLATAFEASRQNGSRFTLLKGEGRCFCAGAEIREFGTEAPAGTPTLPKLLQLIEDHPKPVIALLHGSAVGGGLELALACHYRVMLRSTRVGLPEVKLGLIPGAGGTQRLPRIIPIEEALKLILNGTLIDSETAGKLGLSDLLVGSELLQQGLEFAGFRSKQSPPTNL